MILHSKKTKFRKYFKGRIAGKANSGSIISFGKFGLKALSNCRIKENQIEAARKVINNSLNRAGKLWINIFPNFPVSKKPVEVRMGKGKGEISFWVSKVKSGKVIFELDSVTYAQAKIAFSKASAKLPLKTKFIYINNYF